MNENINTMEAIETVPSINYCGLFFKEKEHDYKGFFANYTYDEEEIARVKREIKKLTDQLAEKNGECAIIMNKRYNDGLVPIGEKMYFSYRNKNNVEFLFDTESGAPINEDDIEGEFRRVELDTKTGKVNIVVGYALMLGAVVTRTYKYTIPSNNARIILTFLSEYLIPIIDGVSDTQVSYPDGTVYTKDREVNYNESWIEGLMGIDAGDFLCSFYNIPKKKVGFDLRMAYKHYTNRKSMETLVRQVNNPDDMNTLLNLPDQEFRGSVAQYIGVTKNEYKILEENDLVRNWIALKTVLEKESVKLSKAGKKYAEKTIPDWTDLMLKARGWEDDFRFYSITFDANGVLCQLVNAYAGISSGWYNHDFRDYPDYYTFGDFCAYIVEGTINQGYKGLKDFLNELADYFKMAKELNVEPTLFSSYLSQTHDITSRNYQVKLSEIQEKQFKERYEGFKPWVSKDKKFTLIAPKDADDVRREGSEMNNCCASYLKRILDDTCRLFFFRSMAAVERSLITVEFRDNAIVQVKRPHNRSITDEDYKYFKELCEAKNWKLKV